MRLKVILSFLAVQLVSFLLWQGVHAINKTPQTAEQTPIIVTPDKDYALSHESAKSPSQPFNSISFSARDNSSESIDPEKKKEILSVLEKLPQNQISDLKNIVLDYDPDAWRGKGGKSIIIIRAVNMDDEEFFGVMIHEIGHNVDLGYLKENSQKKASEFTDTAVGGTTVPIYESDLSVNFYRISWSDTKTRKKDAGNQDFVSGYAMSDPFEDFAETYAYYILHNKDFLSRAQESDKLMEKYNFMKNTVFKGRVYDTGETISGKLAKQPWDVTVLSYSLSDFLQS